MEIRAVAGLESEYLQTERRVVIQIVVFFAYTVARGKTVWRCWVNHRLAQTMIEFESQRSAEADDVLVVRLLGRLDTESAEQFFARLDEEVSNGHRKLVFDCKELTHISSLGFGMMIRAHSRVQKDGGGVRFARLEGFILEAFQIVGFHKLFENYSTVEDAVRSFSEE